MKCSNDQEERLEAVISYPEAVEASAKNGNQVDKAGAVLIDPKSTWEDYTHALQVINNWRSSHSYPLLNFA